MTVFIEENECEKRELFEGAGYSQLCTLEKHLKIDDDYYNLVMYRKMLVS